MGEERLRVDCRRFDPCQRFTALTGHPQSAYDTVEIAILHAGSLRLLIEIQRLDYYPVWQFCGRQLLRGSRRRRATTAHRQPGPSPCFTADMDFQTPITIHHNPNLRISLSFNLQRSFDDEVL